MKNPQEEIDVLIKKALNKEEAEFYDELDEQSLPQLVLSVYQGKMKWIAIGSAIIIVLFFGLSVYCLMQFLNAENTKDMILWGSGMFGGMMVTGFLKLFHWMQMDKNALLREMKRIEFQLSVLATKLDSSDDRI